jgi:choline kinase
MMLIERAILLLAGRGNRMGDLTQDQPKCLLSVAGRPILDRALEALGRAGVQEIVAVVGYRSEKVQAFLEKSAFAGRTRYVFNPDFATTNTAYSLWLAKAHLDKPVFLVEGDIVFGAEVVDRLASVAPSRAAWCAVPAGPHVDTGIMLSVDERRQVQQVALLREPEQNTRRFGFKCAGIQRLTAALAEDLGRTLDEWMALERTRMFADLALAEAMNGHAVHLCDLHGLPWSEVDSPDDLFRAAPTFLSGAPFTHV